MNISDEAVDAAMRGFFTNGIYPEGGGYIVNMRAALDAAAPYLMAAAWDEGHAATLANPLAAAFGYTVNPYRAAGAGE